LVLLLALQVRIVSAGAGPVLWPFTDAFEYASMADWMLRGEGPVLRIGPAFFPSRLPPTLSVLLLPQALFSDPRAYWHSIFVIGVAAVIGFWRLALALGLGPTGAFSAAALLCCSPGFASYAGYVMSDLPALATLLVVLGSALRLFRRDGDAPVALFLGACAAGLLVAFRATHAVWVLGVLLVTPVASWRGLFRRPWFLLGTAVLASLPLIALAVHQWRYFGSPFTTGYEFWLDAQNFFGWRYAQDNARFHLLELAGLRSEFLAQPLGYTSDLYALPVAVLGALGLADFARNPRFDSASRRILVACGIGTVATLAVFATFRWRDWRFLLPCVPWLGFGCGALIDQIAPRFGRRVAPIVVVWLLVIVEAAVLIPLLQRGSAAPLVASTIESERAALQSGGDAPRIETTRLPLALAALLAPRAVVLIPARTDRVGRDIQLELIRTRKLRPLRIDPGHETLWRDLVDAPAP
jgi:hypothetical protein